jgi:hypothetical protein
MMFNPGDKVKSQEDVEFVLQSIEGEVHITSDTPLTIVKYMLHSVPTAYVVEYAGNKFLANEDELEPYNGSG